ncbi:MAG TPA: ATP-binding protein [Pseudomonas sp.]|nr:ATP-binding protein [Pseudomonas sp.]
MRGRLLGFVLVAILLAAVLQALTVYRGALQQADALLDEQLQQIARSMSRGVPSYALADWEIDPEGFELLVQIWGSDGAQLFRSPRAVLPQNAVLGFSDVQANGRRYRVFSLQSGSRTVQIAQDLSARSARAQSLALRAILPFAWLTPLLMLSVWWVITRSLAPLERVRRDVALRAVDDFSALENSALPAEVRPLVDELNLLFGRVRGALELQKHFVADAAHELRSPLTALKLQAQALRRLGDDRVVREAGLNHLDQGVDRAIRLVEQLLLLTREEALTNPAVSGGETVALQDIVRLAVADALPMAAHKQIDLGVVEATAGQSGAGDIRQIDSRIRGQGEALRILLRNLLDNAVKYTPASGRVDVSVAHERGQVTLSVEDSGPGIDPGDRARVFDRFFRASNAPSETGSGLGLAIVRVIAERHGASLVLGKSARLGGLKVDVAFPAA